MKKLLQNKFLNNFCIRIINIIIPIKSVRKKLRVKLYNYRVEELKNEITKKYPDYYQFAMSQPWGDFYIPCALFEEFKRENNNAKIIAVCVNENQEQVLKTFNSIDKIIKIPKEYYYLLFPTVLPKGFEQKLEKGKLYCLFHWLYSDAVKNKSMNFLELYTKMLGLNYPTKLNLPDYKNINKISCLNTILIYPESTSFDCKELTEHFWLELAKMLTDKGYNVIFNTKSQKFENYKTIFLPMQEQIEMAKQCKFVIGMRSGFSDILAINNVENHIVIYPKSMYFKPVTQEQQKKEFKRIFVMEEDKTFEENMHRITSLKMFNDDTIEIYFTDEKTMKEQIINHIKGDINE